MFRLSSVSNVLYCAALRCAVDKNLAWRKRTYFILFFATFFCWQAIPIAVGNCFAALRASAAASRQSRHRSVYVEEMYASWKADPSSVHKSWDVYFRHSEAGRDVSQVGRARMTRGCLADCRPKRAVYRVRVTVAMTV